MGNTAIFGFNPGTHNNAPQPLPTPGGSGMAPNTGGVSNPTSVFAPITPSANTGIFGNNNGIQGLNSALITPQGADASGFAHPGENQLQYDLNTAYGPGIAGVIYQMLTQGLFNPQVASAFLNAMQPAYNRGIASVEQAFGAEGARFGSSAALGIGDFSSQFNLNEQQTLASMFQTSQQQELQLLENILPTMQSEKANRSGGILGDVLGGLETVGGIASLFIPGLQGLAAPLITGGIGTITGSQGGGHGNNNQPIFMNPSPVFNNSTAPDLSSVPMTPPGSTDVFNQSVLSTISAGSTLGGSDPFENNNNNDSSLIPFLFP